MTSTAGAYACDANTVGPDVVIAVEKTSPAVADGGQLLRVTAAPTTANSAANYLNVEVREGACEDAGTIRKCLWYKQNWDVILDGPPGTYFVFVAKNSPTTQVNPFPELRVTAAEIDPEEAEGEGCFAPYTDASAIYTPPANVGLPHTWALPATINSFDMGDTWGEPGSISCDNTDPYGDIHGVDAVIAYNKTLEDSVLLVEVQNQASVLSSSDLNVEVLSVCDPQDPAKRSLQCRANADTYAVTAPAPAGPVYIWVSTEATGEEFSGAQVQVTELALGEGESWPTAEPLAASATVNPTSTQRFDAPSCFPAGVPVHWYRVTSQAEVFGVRSDGLFGVYDAGGQQLGCGSEPFGVLGEPGETFYIALVNAGAPRALELRHGDWDGVRVATSELLALDLGATTATLAPGVNADALGYGLAAVNGRVFSADTTATTSASRIFRIYDGATWGSTPWDANPGYPTASPVNSLAAYQGTLLYATRRTSASTNLYTLPTGASATPTLQGTNTHIWYVVGLAVDASYIYLTGATSQGEGIYRIPRGDLTATPERLAALNTNTTTTPLALDTASTPPILYARDASGDLYAVVDPAGAAIPTGLLYDAETSGSLGLTLDPATGVVYLVDLGRLIRLD